MQKRIRKSTKDQARNDIILGVVFGLIAAFGYTEANTYLRLVIDVDPYWVAGVKAMPTVILFGPWLLVRAARSQALLPPTRPYLLLIGAAVLGQVGGNVVFQWALGKIGLALTVPLCLGAMIITGAWVGWTALGERITRRTLLSIAVLIVAVSVLSLGAPQASAALQGVASLQTWQVALGVAAACFSGVSYALLGVAIRGAAKQGCPAVTTLVTVSLAGILVLWPVSLARMGTAEMFATEPTSLKWMIGAGLANAFAFVALTKSLELIGVVYVNSLNATQAALAAVAGVLIFGEPLSAALGLGVGLTAGGLLLMKPGRRRSNVS